MQVGKIPSRPKPNDASRWYVVESSDEDFSNGPSSLQARACWLGSVSLCVHSAHACMVGYPSRPVKYPEKIGKCEVGWFSELVTGELVGFALHLGV